MEAPPPAASLPRSSTLSSAPSPLAASSKTARSSSRTSPSRPASPPGSTRWARPQKAYILETIGSGVALLDYDNDGWLDIYIVNGSTFDAESGKTEPPHAALFHNNHDGTFTNVADKAGVTNDRWGFGVAVGDFDNDGWPDLYVGNYGKNRLYHNNHDGTFTDVAESAGRNARQLVHRPELRRLRRRRQTRYLRSRLCSLGHEQSAPLRLQGRRLCQLLLSRLPDSCAARADCRASPIISSTTMATARLPT